MRTPRNFVQLREPYPFANPDRYQVRIEVTPSTRRPFGADDELVLPGLFDVDAILHDPGDGISRLWRPIARVSAVRASKIDKVAAQLTAWVYDRAAVLHKQRLTADLATARHMPPIEP